MECWLLTMCCFHSVTDGETYKQTHRRSIYCVMSMHCILRRAVKMRWSVGQVMMNDVSASRYCRRRITNCMRASVHDATTGIMHTLRRSRATCASCVLASVVWSVWTSFMGRRRSRRAVPLWESPATALHMLVSCPCAFDDAVRTTYSSHHS